MQHAGKRRQVGGNGTCRAPRCTGWCAVGACLQAIRALARKRRVTRGEKRVLNPKNLLMAVFVFWNSLLRFCPGNLNSLPAVAALRAVRPSSGTPTVRLRCGSGATVMAGLDPEIIKSGKNGTGFWHVACCVKRVAALSVSRLMNSPAVVARLTPFNARGA